MLFPGFNPDISMYCSMLGSLLLDIFKGQLIQDLVDIDFSISH